MAKKTPVGTKPFDPLKKAFVQGILDPVPVHEPEKEPTTAAPVPRKAASVAEMPERGKSKPTGGGEASAEEPARVTRPGEPLDRPQKFHLAQSEQLELKRLLMDVSESLGTSVGTSHLYRALTLLVLHAHEPLLKRSSQEGPMKRPPNDDRAAIAAFEYRLAKVLSGAFRSAPPLRE